MNCCGGSPNIAGYCSTRPGGKALMPNDSDIVFDVLRSLWDLAPQDPRHRLLPLDRASLEEFLPRLREFVAAAPFQMKGTVDSAALVRGKIVSMWEGSGIEAGAVIY